MALTLLKRVAEKAINTLGGAATSAFDYLSKNAPEVIDKSLEANPMTRVFSQRGQEDVANLGRLMQKMPDTTLHAPEPPEFIKKTPASILFDNPLTRAENKIGEFVTSIPGDMIRETGQALELTATPQGRKDIVTGVTKYPEQTKKLFTPGQRLQGADELLKNPATITLFGLTNIPSPKNLAKKGVQEVVEQGTKQAVKKGAEELLEQGTKELVKEGVEKAAAKTIVKEAVEGSPKLITKTAELFGDDALEQAVKEGAKTTTPINWFSEKTLEPVRAIPKMLGDVADTARKAIFEPLETAKGDAAVFKQDWLKKVADFVPFKAGSKESAAIQQLGEGIKTADDVLREFGEQTGKKIIESNEFFRNTYDEILNQVNTRRVAAGLDEIPKRADYYRHFKEGGGNWLDTLVTGNTGNSELSSSIMKQRKGEKTIFDAVGGFGDYIQKAGRAGYTDEFAHKIQKLSKDLLDNGADPKVSQYLDQYAKEGILGVKEVKDLGNVLNAARNVVKNVGSTVRKNAVLFNARSLMMQTANIPTAIGQTIGTDKKGALYITKGLKNLGKNAEAMAESPFLRDRGFNLPEQFVRPGTLGINKIQDVGGRALQQGDLLPTKFIWNMFYEQGIGNKVDDAIRYADDMTKKMVGGRGIGDLSPAQRSDIGNFLFPFGVEWANSAHALSDMVGKKQIGGLLATLALYHGFNKLAEKTTGTPALFDPIQALMDSGEYATGSDNKEQSTVKAVGRLLAELANVSPYSQNVLSLAYGAAEKLGAPDARDVFGSEDPTRFGNINLYSPFNEKGELRTPLELAAKYNPVGGGSQMRKTIEGLTAGAKGYTESAAGNIFHAVPQDPLSRLQMALFGQWSTPASQEYFDSDYSRPLFKDERKTLDTLPANERPDYIRQVNADRREQTAGDSYFDDAENENWFSKLLGGEKKAPTKDAIVTHYFNGKTYKEANRTDQRKILTKMLEISDDEKLTPQEKANIANAVGVNGADLEYYRAASMNADDRLEGLLMLSTQDYQNRDEFIQDLILGKRSVGGKSLFSSTMMERLYDEGLISKEEKSLIAAVKFDPVFNKFYMDRDFKSGGSAAATASKIRSYISSVNALHKSPFKSSKTGVSDSVQKALAEPLEAPKLNFTRAPKNMGTSSQRWFNAY